MARAKPLVDLIEACIGPAFAAQGFASGDILAAWPGIVGTRLAGACRPLKLEWPRGARRQPDEKPVPGTLIVQVEGAFALELQHLAPIVVQRVNAHYGWACVGRIVLKQGRVQRHARRAPAPPLDPATRGAVALAVSRVEEAGLREALDRLGQAVAVNDRLPR